MSYFNRKSKVNLDSTSGIFSPVSALVANLQDLSTSFSEVDATPRRRLSLCSEIGTPEYVKSTPISEDSSNKENCGVSKRFQHQHGQSRTNDSSPLCLQLLNGNLPAKLSQTESLKMIFDEESRDSGLPDAEGSQHSSWSIQEHELSATASETTKTNGELAGRHKLLQADMSSAQKILTRRCVSFNDCQSSLRKRYIESPSFDDTPKLLKRSRTAATGFLPQKRDGSARCLTSFADIDADDGEIKSALSRGDEHDNLIGDFSRPYCLPLDNSKRRGLCSISPSTLSKVLLGEYRSVIGQLVLIDCRYPYEFEGGHIEGAINVFTKEDAMKIFIESDKYRPASSDAASYRTILVFHCEYSSERAPALLRFLRAEDRKCNSTRYPALHFPEIYLLDGGYKAFFEQCKQLCKPCNYVPMVHEDYTADLRRFKTKSKTWGGEKNVRSVFKAGC